MPAIEEEVRAALLAETDITDLVGSRVYGENRPEALLTRPFIVIAESIEEPDEESRTFQSKGLIRTAVTLSAIADNMDGAKDLAEVIIDVLEDFRGELTATFKVQLIRLIGSRDAGYSDISTGQRWDVEFEFIYR